MDWNFWRYLKWLDGPRKDLIQTNRRGRLGFKYIMMSEMTFLFMSVTRVVLPDNASAAWICDNGLVHLVAHTYPQNRYPAQIALSSTPRNRGWVACISGVNQGKCILSCIWVDHREMKGLWQGLLSGFDLVQGWCVVGRLRWMQNK